MIQPVNRLARRRFIRKLSAALMGSAALAIGAYAYTRHIEPDWFAVEQIPLVLPRLDAAFDHFRLVQISDLHLSERMSGARLAQVVKKIMALQPDLVAITGDFVDRLDLLDSSLADLYQALKPLTDHVQVVAVLGNHDYWTDVKQVRKALQETGILELPNQVLDLQRDEAHLWIAGVDNIWEGHDRLPSVLAQIGPSSGAAILLAHEPDFADISHESGRFDLQISGHSHGGQVILPLIGPPVLPRLARKYPVGLYRLGQMVQYTSRGLGTVPPAIRFNCRPEITLFTLLSPDGG